MSRETSVQEWRRFSELDRKAAKHVLESNDYEACIFHCHQAVEKLLKAIVVSQTKSPPPHTHNFRAILDRISGIDIEEVEAALSSINGYYVGSRYPLDQVNPDVFQKPLAESAVQKTEQVFEWFLAHINFENE